MGLINISHGSGDNIYFDHKTDNVINSVAVFSITKYLLSVIIVLLYIHNLNPFPVVHDKCCLVFLPLIMYIGGLYCKQYGPRSDCSLRSSLIRVHSVCLHDQK